MTGFVRGLLGMLLGDRKRHSTEEPLQEQIDENKSPNAGDGSGAAALRLHTAVPREGDQGGKDASLARQCDEASMCLAPSTMAQPSNAALPAQWEGIMLRAPLTSAPYVVGH